MGNTEEKRIIGMNIRQCGKNGPGMLVRAPRIVPVAGKRKRNETVSGMAEDTERAAQQTVNFFFYLR